MFRMSHPKANNCHNINELTINPGGQPEENHIGLLCYYVYFKNSYLRKVTSHLSRDSGNSKIAASSLPKSWKAMLTAASVEGSTEVCGVAASAGRHRGDLYQQQMLQSLIAFTLLAGAANINHLSMFFYDSLIS